MSNRATDDTATDDRAGGRMDASGDLNDIDGDTRAGVSRRRLVAAGAVTWTSVGLAGCSDSDDDDNGDDPTESVTVTATTTTTREGTDPDDGTGGGDDETGAPTETSAGTPTKTPTPAPTATTTGTCANGMTFLAGASVGFLVGTFSSTTGEALGPDAIESVAVQFPKSDLSTLELSWTGPHREVIDDRWGGKLSTGGDFESGAFEYEVVVTTADGATITKADQFGVLDPLE